MGTSAKALFLEAMKLDEANELVLATSKYLEALLQFGALLLETSQKQVVHEIQSKTFGNHTKAAMQCLDRVFAIHQHFQKQIVGSSSSPTLTIRHADHPVSDRPPLSPSSSSPSLSPILRHQAVMPVQQVEHAAKATNPLAEAMVNNQRLILQFQEVIRQKQQHQNSSLSGARVAHMETELQKKLTENLAVAKYQQRVAEMPPGSSMTLPRGFGRSSIDAGDSATRTTSPKKPFKKKLSAGITHWPTMASHDITLGVGTTIGDRWRSKSGDRLHAQRLSSDTSLFDETEFANLLADGDSDNEVPAPPNGALLATIEDTFGVDQCAQLTLNQKQQQQVIIELIYTERTHVRSMKVLQKLFYQPLSRSNILPRNFVSYMPVTFLELVFANLDEVVELHTAIGKRLKAVEKERRVVNDIGAVLLEFFDGDFSEKFKKAVAQFCKHQQYALEQLELRRQQDNAFATIIQMAESHPACHGFKLRDFIPTEMQRLSKYPLLFERLLKYADPDDSSEIGRLKRCHYNAQQILAYMNTQKRDFENSKKLAEIQSRLDTSPFYRVQHPLVVEFRKFNLQQQGFVMEGQLRMRRLDSTVIEMHGVLCERVLLLLTKRGLGADGRLRLQFHEESVYVGANRQSVLVQFCPIIKLTDAKLKDAASCDKEFYIISTFGEVTLYHLMTPDSESKVKWTKAIQKQINKVSKVGHQGSQEGIVTVTSASSLEASPSRDEGEYTGSTVVVVVQDEDDDEDADFAEFSDGDEDLNFTEQTDRPKT